MRASTIMPATKPFTSMVASGRTSLMRMLQQDRHAEKEQESVTSSGKAAEDCLVDVGGKAQRRSSDACPAL